MKKLEIETAGNRVVCRWQEATFPNLNLVDEVVILKVLRDDTVVEEHQVEHLSQKELHLNQGDYTVELARFFKPEIEVRSPLVPTPSVAWRSDSPATHLFTWQGIDWEEVRREVERIHKLDWEQDISVALRVLKGEDEALINQWIPVPFRDHVNTAGPVHEIELAVVKSADESILKSLFLARPCPTNPLQVYARQEFTVVDPAPTVRLFREIIETDTIQARVEWSNLGGKTRILELLCDGKVIVKQEKLPSDGDWYFPGLAPGRYEAKIRAGRKTFTSQAIHLQAPETRCRLLPVSENRAFCYWHIGEQVWRSLTEEFGSLQDRTTCFLEVAYQRGDKLVPVPELSRLIDLGHTSDYYLDLAPDLVYRTRLLARIDNHERRPLCDWSNPCQLARESAGRAPIRHKKGPRPDHHPTVRPLSGPTRVSQHSWGYLMLHLHAHLPYIADPINFGPGDWSPMGYPQEWYPQAVCDTYLPLLDAFETLQREGVDFKLSMDISPPLAAMMTSQRHASDVLSFLERSIKKAALEVERTGRDEPHYTPAAWMHLSNFKRCRELFLGYNGDLASAFAALQDSGHLELLTCVGTHPMLPLWTSQPEAIRGHVLAAARSHERIFGRPTQGVWLPECAYTPGIEHFLEEAGFLYTFGEEHSVTRGDAPPEFGVNAPVYARGSNLCIFPRDPETSRQVWSGDEGYPGDPDYLEFHIRGGPFKYNRITDREAGFNKRPYNPDWANSKAAQHAEHFLHCRNARFEYLKSAMWKKPVVVAPYDAELFGHHWYEGPRFLYYLFKKLHYDQNRTELTTPTAYLSTNPASQDMYCNVSSWGHQGSFVKWLHGDTSWMYRHGHEAAAGLKVALASGVDSDLERRVLAQAARQLMIATSSDLPFVISNGHFVDRMKEQLTVNLKGFYELLEDFRRLKDGADIDLERLRGWELQNNLFPDLDPRWFG